MTFLVVEQNCVVYKISIPKCLAYIYNLFQQTPGNLAGCNCESSKNKIDRTWKRSSAYYLFFIWREGIYQERLACRHWGFSILPWLFHPQLSKNLFYLYTHYVCCCSMGIAYISLSVSLSSCWYNSIVDPVTSIQYDYKSQTSAAGLWYECQNMRLLSRPWWAV